MFQEGRTALHYAPANAGAMRLFSVLVNAGADPTLEDNRGHNSQYYIDHQNEIVIPEWTNRWSNIMMAQSPTPGQRKAERSAKAKERSALIKANLEAAKSARRKKRDGKTMKKDMMDFLHNDDGSLLALLASFDRKSKIKYTLCNLIG